MKIEVTSIVLIVSNIIAITIALAMNYSFNFMMWVYWLESVAIGFFVFLGMLLTAKDFATRGGAIFVIPVFLAFFFAFHYGLFHFVYLVFLAVLPWTRIGLLELPQLLLAAFVLFLSHGYSFYKNILTKKQDTGAVTAAQIMDVQKQFAEPYARIIPMHIIIIFSGFIAGVAGANLNAILLVAFGGLKTFADLALHLRKNKIELKVM